MTKLSNALFAWVQEHPRGWRRGMHATYALLVAQNLVFVVLQTSLWVINFAVAIFCIGIWIALVLVWRRQDECGEIERLVVEDLDHEHLGIVSWLWADGRAGWERREVIAWLGSHQLFSVHPDDLPPPVRDLALIMAALRS